MITPYDIKTELEYINYRMLIIAGTTTEVIQQLDILRQKINVRYAEEIKKETDKLANDYVDYES